MFEVTTYVLFIFSHTPILRIVCSVDKTGKWVPYSGLIVYSIPAQNTFRPFDNLHCVTSTP